MVKADDHPEQDPAEGSPETIDRNLKEQEEKRRNSNDSAGRNAPETSFPGAEAAEPSPGS